MGRFVVERGCKPMNNRRKAKEPGFYPVDYYGRASAYRTNRQLSPLQLLRWKPERFSMTDDFRRLIFPLLVPGDDPKEGHHYIYMVSKERPFADFFWFLSKPDAECSARHVLQMFERQMTEQHGKDYFSKEFVNYARVGPTLWIAVIPWRKAKSRWLFHAFDTSDPVWQERNKDVVLKPGMRIISRRGAV